jgi:hypothetical protein
MYLQPVEVGAQVIGIVALGVLLQQLVLDNSFVFGLMITLVKT